MILFEGKLYKDDEIDSILEKLPDSIVSAIEKRERIANRVIEACDRVISNIIRAGLTHIVHGAHMSHTEADATHDGEYPLRCYSRIIQIEKGNT